MINNINNELRRLYKKGWPFFYAKWRTKLYRKRFDTIIDNLPNNGRVVDIGCGYGLLANIISLAKPELMIVGIDTDRKRIDIANQSIQGRKNIKFTDADAREFKFQDGDVVMFVDSLHHIPKDDHSALLKSVANMIGANGRLLISDIEKKPRWKYLVTYIVDTLLYPFSTRCQFYSRAEMHSLLQNSGWKEKNTRSTARGSVFSTILYDSKKNI
jgi:2-polyprenyl-3-methyl-5-hydroxy-6-metoxy-1,4-benzoquinol methylase